MRGREQSALTESSADYYFLDRLVSAWRSKRHRIVGLLGFVNVLWLGRIDTRLRHGSAR